MCVSCVIEPRKYELLVSAMLNESLDRKERPTLVREVPTAGVLEQGKRKRADRQPVRRCHFQLHHYRESEPG
jgi:hypothetical protein